MNMRRPMLRATRVALVVVVLLVDLFFSGAVFGWAPLLLLLQDEQQYAELCPKSQPCVAQENRLNLMFALAVVATNGASLPVGVFLDRFGPKATAALAGVVQVAALVLLALADSRSFDVFVPAYVLLAIGGAITMMASYPASFLIMQHQTAILAAISCLFDGSSVVFLLLYSIHAVFRVSRFALFMGYAAFAIIVYTLLVVLWHLNECELFRRQESLGLVPLHDPSTTSKGERQALVEKSDMSRSSPVSEKAAKQLLKSHYLDYGTLSEAQLAARHDQEEIHELYRTGLIEYELHGMPIMQQVRTFEFGYVLVYACTQVLRASIYIGTANKLLLNYGDADRHFLYTKIFSLVLPLGFVFVPAIDFVVERPGGLTLGLVLTTAMGFLYSALALIPVLPVQSATFIVFTGFRAFLYAVISAFTAKTFGLKNLGTLMGIIFSVGALVSLLEYPAVYLSNMQADGDLTVVYWLSLLACVVLVPLTLIYFRREKQREKTHKELLSHFDSSLLSPEHPHGGSAGLSYRRSPCLSSPSVRFTARETPEPSKRSKLSQDRSRSIA